MTTANGARAVVQSRIETNAPVDVSNNAVTLHWQDEDTIVLPDVPKPFVYTEVYLERKAEIVGYGAGRGSNLYRNYSCIDSYVFVPQDHGVIEAELIAEQIATLFRSYRDTDISCFDASVISGSHAGSIKPPSVTSEVSNYLWAIASISMFYDQIG